MFWRDHNPPHFHARYGEYEIIVEIETGKDIEKFKSFKVDPVLGTIVWDSGVDLAPEFLYEKLKVLT